MFSFCIGFQSSRNLFDGFQFIVPLNAAVSTEAAMRVIAELTQTPGPSELTLFESQRADIVIPADGFHIEPIAGACVLQELPADRPSVHTSIQVDADG